MNISRELPGAPGSPSLGRARRGRQGPSDPPGSSRGGRGLATVVRPRGGPITSFLDRIAPWDRAQGKTWGDKFGGDPRTGTGEWKVELRPWDRKGARAKAIALYNQNWVLGKRPGGIRKEIREPVKYLEYRDLGKEDGPGIRVHKRTNIVAGKRKEEMGLEIEIREQEGGAREEEIGIEEEEEGIGWEEWEGGGIMEEEVEGWEGEGIG